MGSYHKSNKLLMGSYHKSNMLLTISSRSCCLGLTGSPRRAEGNGPAEAALPLVGSSAAAVSSAGSWA